MNNASFHKFKQLKIPKNIKIEYILSYSPELNPQARKKIRRYKKEILKK